MRTRVGNERWPLKFAALFSAVAPLENAIKNLCLPTPNNNFIVEVGKI